MCSIIATWQHQSVEELSYGQSISFQKLCARAYYGRGVCSDSYQGTLVNLPSFHQPEDYIASHDLGQTGAFSPLTLQLSKEQRISFLIVDGPRLCTAVGSWLVHENFCQFNLFCWYSIDVLLNEELALSLRKCTLLQSCWVLSVNARLSVCTIEMNKDILEFVDLPFLPFFWFLPLFWFWPSPFPAPLADWSPPLQSASNISPPPYFWSYFLLVPLIISSASIFYMSRKLSIPS